MRTERKGGPSAWWILKGLGIVVLVAVAVGLLSLAFMTLWNAVVPGVFGLKPIDWPLALGLLILARILVGFHGFHGHPGRGHGWGHGHGYGPRFTGEGWGHRADQWRHYGEFWKEEGQVAFEAYLKRRETPPTV